MTTAELAKVIGKTGFLIQVGHFTVAIVVKDAKIAYGNVRYLVEPVSGQGQVWVDSSRVHFADEKEKQ